MVSRSQPVNKTSPLNTHGVGKSLNHDDSCRIMYLEGERFG
jgi:hypothetical protein